MWARPETPASEPCPVVAGGVGGAGGRFVVAWQGASGVQQIRAFSPAGVPLAPPFPLGAPVPKGLLPALGLDGSGRFVVLWRGGAGRDLLERRFDTSGAPLGPAFLVGELALTYNNFGLAMAEDGGFTVVWPGEPAGGGLPVLLRRFAADGTPFAPVEVGQLDVLWPGIAHLSADRHSLRARHEADLCLYRGSRFLCDTAGEGKVTAEIQLGLGMPRFVPLLGDIDGDGRADPCLYRQGSLVCGQFAKTGGKPLATFTRGTAGEPGDVPLLGDLDAF